MNKIVNLRTNKSENRLCFICQGMCKSRRNQYICRQGYYSVLVKSMQAAAFLSEKLEAETWLESGRGSVMKPGRLCSPRPPPPSFPTTRRPLPSSLPLSSPFIIHVPRPALVSSSFCEDMSGPLNETVKRSCHTVASSDTFPWLQLATNPVGEWTNRKQM